MNFVGTPPAECQLCHAPITTVFIDGRISGASQWAYMCPVCHRMDGVGLGTGLGQRYEKQADGTWIKTQG